MKPTVLLLLLVFIASCSSIYTTKHRVNEVKLQLSGDQIENWSLMSGAWYAIQPTKIGGVRQVISERYPDGTYKIRFKTIRKDGEINEQTEIGQWGLVGNIYFSIYRGILTPEGIKYSNTSDPFNYDAYRVIELTESKLVYESIIEKTVFSAVRVDFDYAFPETDI